MHPAFREFPKAKGNTAWLEFRACEALGLDPELHVEKSREARAVNVAGYFAAASIEAMQLWERKKEMEDKRKKGAKGRKR